MTEIIELTLRDEMFYKIVGPIALDYSIEKEIGYKPYDSKKHRWFAAYCDGEIAGVASIKNNSFCIAYVYPLYRKLGIHKLLVEARINCCDGTAKVVCNNISKNAFIKNGFTIYKTTKKWFFLEKQIHKELL